MIQVVIISDMNIVGGKTSLVVEYSLLRRDFRLIDVIDIHIILNWPEHQR